MNARTIDGLLSLRAAELGDRCFLRFRSGDLSFTTVDERATELAHAFSDLGVARRDLVAMLLPNCPEFALVWFGLARLGAVSAPINTASRGGVLAHVLNLTRAEIVVVDEDFAEALEPIVTRLEHVRALVVRGDHRLVAERLPRLRVLGLSQLEAAGRRPPASRNEEQDLAMLLFTSGTTGRSKGCELSHRYAVRHAELIVEHLQLRSDDVLYCPFPLFHLDATVLTVMPALVLGATAALGERFSVSGFWDEVRAFGATVFDFMGATLTLLHKCPPAPDDHDNPVRLAWGVPLPDFGSDFERRFGLRLTELYGLTDAGVVMFEPQDEPRRPGTCGRPVEAFDVRLFDESDNEVPVGEVGEIVLRPREPGLTADGYYGMPEESLAVRGNLWFHTGDLARRDVDGFYYFVGRRHDVIRRRGENISAFEVEEVINAHPDVLEVAAFGVPSELSEEDVMLSIVPRPGLLLDPAAIVEFSTERMARHMVPRYVDIVTELPRTPTEKVEKYRLVQLGVTERTWDRESNA